MDPHTKAQYNENVKKVKDKERHLRAAREKQLVMYKGNAIMLPADFHQKLYRPEGSA